MIKYRGKPRGFSLIELLIVVGVILIITALAVPNLLRSKMAAKEASAVSSLRTLNSSCVTYSSTWTGFPLQLSYMGPGKPYSSRTADLIDSALAAGTKSGYKFSYISGPPSGGQIRSYTISTSPSVANLTGTRYFFTDQTGVIRQNSGAPATATSTPLK
jgi:prepilin-type N-terminal cleavage/methylation domain-containing protein